MNIVLGVCGFGLGHSVRQRPILEGLIARGHKIILIANDQGYHFFAQHHPQVRLIRAYVPVIHSTPTGLDFAGTANDPRNALAGSNAAFWNACGIIEREFGKPDIVISDYDLVSAQIAYLFDAPLITLDQQSKFLGYAFPNIGGFNPDEHRMRLRYFFPKVRTRFATSFSKVEYAPVAEYPVTIIPPIIGQDVKHNIGTPIARQVAVYISTANRIQQSLDELASVFACFPDWNFFCFVEGSISQRPSNVFPIPYSREHFLSHLGQSSAVIATAGHNLITEALYLNVPMFLLPFAHYEQQLNAYVIESAGLGCADSMVSESKLREFFSQLDMYRHRNHPVIYRQFDGDTVFLNFIETLEA